MKLLKIKDLENINVETQKNSLYESLNFLKYRNNEITTRNINSIINNLINIYHSCYFFDNKEFITAFGDEMYFEQEDIEVIIKMLSVLKHINNKTNTERDKRIIIFNLVFVLEYNQFLCEIKEQVDQLLKDFAMYDLKDIKNPEEILEDIFNKYNYLYSEIYDVQYDNDSIIN